MGCEAYFTIDIFFYAINNVDKICVELFNTYIVNMVDGNLNILATALLNQ